MLSGHGALVCLSSSFMSESLIDLTNPNELLSGVMLNAYPDSMGANVKDLVSILEGSSMAHAFSQLYLLPTFFNSDLDRGFSIIDYDLNQDLVNRRDLDQLKQAGITLKLDIVLNHLSVASPQFKDLLRHGAKSKFKDFFIDWNVFWEGKGSKDHRGVIVPEQRYLDHLFMRKPGLPVLKVPFDQGDDRYYWNTFYQQVSLSPSIIDDLKHRRAANHDLCTRLFNDLTQAVLGHEDLTKIDLTGYAINHDALVSLVRKHVSFLGQMDVNAQSPEVWVFYQDTLNKLQEYGCKILRLDAFAYLHKEMGQTNFFNKPGTWHYLDRLKTMAEQNNLWVLPEIHAEYGQHLHDQVAAQGYGIYDFFLPGLVIHTIENADPTPLLKWATEIIDKKFKVVNMLGCHDGIPVLDLKGKEIDGHFHKGLLSDPQIDRLVDLILTRGGRIKNLFGPDGSKISYYQVNATYYSALGADDQKLLLARAIQLFMPGLPQIWYLDLFAGENDHQAADRAGKEGHKEINRTNLSVAEINKRLETEVVQKQLKMIRFRNTANAFKGVLELPSTYQNTLHMIWRNGDECAEFKADLLTHAFTIKSSENGRFQDIV